MTSERYLINCAIDRSGAVITDSDVIKRLETMITTESRLVDGFLRGHVEVPINPTVTALTGTFTFSNGSTELTGVGTSFSTELSIGDEIRLDDEPNIRAHIKSITDDLNASLEFVYYGTVEVGTANLYVTNVPEEVDNALARHMSWKLWQRRGRTGDDNPHYADEMFFRTLMKDIKEGRYRFDTATNKEISKKPTHYDESIEFTMTDSALSDYIP